MGLPLADLDLRTLSQVAEDGRRRACYVIRLASHVSVRRRLLGQNVLLTCQLDSVGDHFHLFHDETHARFLNLAHGYLLDLMLHEEQDVLVICIECVCTSVPSLDNFTKASATATGPATSPSTSLSKITSSKRLPPTSPSSIV